MTDDKDLCPNTEVGVEVDETGCEVEEETPAVVDTDGDGVPDTLDKCANTPTGSTVDATGCVVTTGGETTTPVTPQRQTTN